LALRLTLSFPPPQRKKTVQSDRTRIPFRIA
jgi:hypothetical protein